MKEIWKNIPFYEGFYRASNLGRVKSLERTQKYLNRKQKEKILKPVLSVYGYPYVILSKNQIKKGFAVHRLICLAFIPNIFSFPQVNHKNGIKTDNRINNLEWCSSSYNNKHAYLNNLNTAKGSKNSQAKLNENNVIQIRKLWNNNPHELAKIFGTSYKNILLIINRKRWRHI